MAVQIWVFPLPGLPMIYYGDEGGLEGYSDPFNRMPYPYGNEDEELLAHYKKIGQIRRKHSVYKSGVFSLIALTNAYLVFLRESISYAYITFLNQDSVPIKISFDACGTDLLSGQKGNEFLISPNAATIIKIKKYFEFQINKG